MSVSVIMHTWVTEGEEKEKAAKEAQENLKTGKWPRGETILWR